MSDPITEAQQSALSAEYRAVFGYGLLGPWLGAADTDRARAAQLAHADLRDATAAALLAAGATPDAPEADYALGAVRNDRRAITLAVDLEEDCAAQWRHLYAVAAGSSDGSARAVRRSAQQALTASAVRAAQWRLLLDPATATVPFPGI